MHYLSKMAIAASAAFASVAMAHIHDETRHADAHVHGAGHLNFAVEGKEVHLELEIPGFDILGFESVTTDAQRKQVSEAIHDLQGGSLWSFPAAASCRLISTSAYVGGEDDHENNHHDHDSHKHEDKHDHDSHKHEDKHDHEEGHHEHESAHMDFEATYIYECAQPGELNALFTTLFERFKNSEMLKVQGFTDAGQIAATMSRKQPEVRF